MNNPVKTDQLETRVLLPDQPEEGFVKGQVVERPQAPSRLPGLPLPLGAAPAEQALDEPAIFAAVRRFYLREERRHLSPLALLECQEVPPQAVSLISSPSRAWLLRLACGDTKGIDCPTEALVFLQEEELQLIWR